MPFTPVTSLWTHLFQLFTLSCYFLLSSSLIYPATLLHIFKLILLRHKPELAVFTPNANHCLLFLSLCSETQGRKFGIMLHLILSFVLISNSSIIMTFQISHVSEPTAYTGRNWEWILWVLTVVDCVRLEKEDLV